VLLRRALVGDIARIMAIRLAVQENRLSDPRSVTVADCQRFVDKGRFWVGEVAGVIVGFSASDERDGTIWALFLDPAWQGRGFGPALLARACADLHADGYRVARLTTDPGTRAERMYRRLGWQDHGIGADGEVRFSLAL
jgi:GNAT superfamily N-acetyltransferase